MVYYLYLQYTYGIYTNMSEVCISGISLRFSVASRANAQPCVSHMHKHAVYMCVLYIYVYMYVYIYIYMYMYTHDILNVFRCGKAIPCFFF